MPGIVILIVVIVLVVLLAKAYHDARQAQPGDKPAAGSELLRQQLSRPRRQREPRQESPPPSPPKVDEEQLAEHVAKLREAVAAELVTMQEAVDSVVRQTSGQLSSEAARQLLDKRDAA